MIRQATAADLLFVRDLQRRFTNQIGFLPTEATQRELARGRIMIGTLNDAEAGFLYTLPALASQPTTTAIIQTAVRMDAQRQLLGLTMINAIASAATAAGQTILQAWCKANLEANHFWQAAGFKAIATRPGGNRKHIPHILWRLALDDSAELTILPADKYNRLPGGRFAKRECRTTANPLTTAPPSLS
jgi:N-acetylglutamate synthase-like GNAT family acetyltransferase